MSAAKSSSGFTLLELLIVIIIIGILSTIGFTIFSSAQKSARDAKRKSELNSIAKAYEVKYSVNGRYVALTGSDFSSGSVPKDPAGNDYYNVVAEDGSGFRVCVALEANSTRTCDTESAATCQCRTSQQATLTTGVNLVGTGIGGGPTPTGGASCDSAGTLNTGLVSYWKMDEASWNGTAGEMRDSAGSNHGKGTNGANTTNNQAKFYRSAIVDGTNDWMEVPNSSSLQIKPNMSVSIWIKTSDNNAVGHIIMGKVGTVGPETWEYTLNYNAGAPRFAIYNTAGGIYLFAISTANIADGAWHHLVGTFNSAAPEARIYVDGVMWNAIVPTGTLQSTPGTARFGIGQRSDEVPAYYPAQFDEARLWNKTLSGPDTNCSSSPNNEVCRLYNNGNGCLP